MTLTHPHDVNIIHSIIILNLFLNITAFYFFNDSFIFNYQIVSNSTPCFPCIIISVCTFVLCL